MRRCSIATKSLRPKTTLKRSMQIQAWNESSMAAIIWSSGIATVNRVWYLFERHPQLYFNMLTPSRRGVELCVAFRRVFICYRSWLSQFTFLVRKWPNRNSAKYKHETFSTTSNEMWFYSLTICASLALFGIMESNWTLLWWEPPQNNQESTATNLNYKMDTCTFHEDIPLLFTISYI